MGAGNFFAGLLGGYTGSLVKDEARQYQQNLAASEMRIHSALSAWDAAMKTGDKNAMGAATQNLDEAIGALQDIGKKKSKPKKQTPHGGILQSIIGAVSGGQQGQQGQQAALPPMPGIKQGAGGMPYDPGISAGSAQGSTPVPPQAPQAQTMPQMPSRPSGLAGVIDAMPGIEQQAATAGSAQAAETGARFKALKTQEEQVLGRPLTTDESETLLKQVSNILPKNISLKPTLMTAKAPITAGNAPQNATTADGRMASDLPKDSLVNLWEYPDGKIVAFPASANPVSSSASAPKVNSQNGIPISVSSQGRTFKIDDPNMPDDLKPVAAEAIKAHAQFMKDKATDEARRSAIMAERTINTLFGLLPGESLYNQRKGGKGNQASRSATASPSRSSNGKPPARVNQEYLGTLNPKIASLVREIGTGKMPLERFGYILTRNPSLASMVSQAYPDFDGSKVQSYIATVKDFTSGKTAISLNAGATALKHMQELMNLNTYGSRIPGSSASKAFNNKLDTVVGELVRFYQMPSTNQSYDSMKETLGGTFNRDAAIRSQINSMADKLASYAQQWQNAAPSAQYEAPMPHIDEKAKRALVQIDPEFASDYPDIASIFTPKGASSKSNQGFSVSAPNGKVYRFDTKEQADRFRKEAGL